MSKTNKRRKRLALCVGNDEYPASLEVNKLYLVLPEESEQDLDMLRVVDESGEDYLYPRELFALLPENALEALRISPKLRRRVLKSLESA